MILHITIKSNYLKVLDSDQKKTDSIEDQPTLGKRKQQWENFPFYQLLFWGQAQVYAMQDSYNYNKNTLLAWKKQKKDAGQPPQKENERVILEKRQRR